MRFPVFLTLAALWLSTVSADQPAAAGDPGLRLADPAVLEALRATDTPGLPRNLAPEERPHLRLPDLSRIPRITPIADDLVTASEFERNEAILMRWGNFNSVLTEMIVPITTGDSLARVLLVVANSSQQASASNILNNAGADLDRVEFVIAPSNSVWIRDYGPRFTSADNDRVIIDHQYNRPRPLDNQIPSAIAVYLDEELYEMPINHGGGNFHLFANGEAYATDLIVDENPGYTDQDVIDLYAQYQGLDLTLLPALPASFDSTQHLDMWFLPVDDRTVIIGDYGNPPPGVSPSADTAAVIEATEFTTSLMEERGYQVLRTPGWKAQGFNTPHRTYTNAVIVNDLVLVCRFDGFETQNAQARSVFEQAFPDLDIVPVDCSTIINSSGALHCIVKHQPAPAFRLETEITEATVCRPDSGTETLTIGVALQGINGFDEEVTLMSLGEPAGISTAFDPPTLSASGEAEWNVTVDAGAASGTTGILLIGEDGVGPGLPVDFSLTLEAPLPSPVLLEPTDQAVDVSLTPVLEWQQQAEAAEYRVQLAADPDFSNVLFDEWVSDSQLAVDMHLASGELHFWRVMAVNSCDGEWSEVRQFRTRFDPVAAVTPDNFEFEVSANGSDTDFLTITNAGDGDLEWSIETQRCSGTSVAPWLQVDTVSGTTAAGQSSSVEVSVDADGLSPATYQGGLCVSSNEYQGMAQTVPILLNVTAPLPGQPQFEPDTGTLSFGKVTVGTELSLDLELTNVAETGSEALAIGPVQVVAGQSVFGLTETGTGCDDSLTAQTSCTIRVVFSPLSPAVQSGILRVRVDGQNYDFALAGVGEEAEPQLFSDRFESGPAD